MYKWKRAAHHCEITYGVHVDWEERFFHCPECDEPIYECDWNDEDIPTRLCPVCESDLFADQKGE